MPLQSGPVNLDAVVLAGGLGLRLRSLVADKPKVVAEVRDRPFVAYVLDQLAAFGAAKIVLCTGHLADGVVRALGSAHGETPLEYSHEPAPLGTGGAVRLALGRIRSPEALVLNGDSYCRVNLAGLVRAHRARHARITMAVVRMDDTRRFGRVEVGPDFAVKRFLEKDQSDGPGLVNAGIYVMAREAIEAIPPDRAVSLEREVFPLFVGGGLFAHAAEGPLWDIGVPDEYLRARKEFRFGEQEVEP